MAGVGVLLGLAAVLVALEVYAEVNLERWARSRSHWLFIRGLSAYMVIAVVFGLAMTRVKNLTVLNTIWQCSNLVVVALFGTYVLKQKLKPLHALGVVLGAVSCVLIAT